jgi:hypothetical protein
VSETIREYIHRRVGACYAIVLIGIGICMFMPAPAGTVIGGGVVLVAIIAMNRIKYPCCNTRMGQPASVGVPFWKQNDHCPYCGRRLNEFRPKDES